jgi:hypothetical protein
MFSVALKPLNHKIKKLTAKRRPTKRDLAELEVLMAQQYYQLTLSMQSIHFIDHSDGAMQ